MEDKNGFIFAIDLKCKKPLNESVKLLRILIGHQGSSTDLQKGTNTPKSEHFRVECSSPFWECARVQTRVYSELTRQMNALRRTSVWTIPNMPGVIIVHIW